MRNHDSLSDALTRSVDFHMMIIIVVGFISFCLGAICYRIYTFRKNYDEQINSQSGVIKSGGEIEFDSGR